MADRSALESFAAAIDREAHHLVARPNILWQQLQNRLQWAGDPIRETLAAAAEQRSRRGLVWIRTRTPLAESAAFVRTLIGHRDSVNDLALSGDGSSLVSAGEDGSLRIWDVARGEQRHIVTGGHARVRGCALAPDRSLVAYAGKEHKIWIWDLAGGRHLDPLIGHSKKVEACAWSPDGGSLVSASDDGTLKIWDPESGTVRRTLEGHNGFVYDCVVSPDGTFIVSAGSDGALRIWDPDSGEDLLILEGHAEGFEFQGARPGVLACAVSPDARTVVSAGGDRSVRVWDVGSGRQVRSMHGHDHWVVDCAVSPDGTLAASASWDQSVRIWDLSTGDEVGSLIGHTFFANACAFSPDGGLLFTGSADRTVKVWRVDSALRTPATPHHDGWVFDCDVSPDGSYVVSAGFDGALKIWDPESRELRRTIRAHRGRALVCRASPGGGFLVSGGEDETARVWDPHTGKSKHTLKHLSGQGDVYECSVTPDESRIVTSAGAGIHRVWDAKSGRLIQDMFKKPLPRGASTLVQSFEWGMWGGRIGPDGWVRSVEKSGPRRRLLIWDPRNCSEYRAIETFEDYTRTALSPTGDLEVLWGTEQMHGKSPGPRASLLWVWNGADPATAAVLGRHEAEGVADCDVTPDGGHVVSVGYDGLLKVWNPWTLEEEATIAFPGRLVSVAMYPDALRFACGDEGGYVYLLDLVGIECGPLVVTAMEGPETPSVRCPSCRAGFSIERSSLGTVLQCPDCRRGLRVNAFVVKTSEDGGGWSLRSSLAKLRRAR